MRCAFIIVLLCLLSAWGPVSFAAAGGGVPNWGSCTAEPPPPLDFPEAVATDEELEIFSGKAEFQFDGDAKFSDRIILRSGNHSLSADGASYDAGKGVFAVKGSVEYRDPETRIVASEARLDRIRSEVRFSSAEFEVWSVPARGSADEIKIEASGKLRLKEATYTSCPAGNDDWKLRASRIRINQETGIGAARGVRLDFKGIPILYLPYISYPATNKRKTGWLIPDLGSSQQRGVDIAAPYYWNIAPNYDTTLTPRYMSKRGVQLNGEFRYLTSIHDGTLLGEYLKNDDVTGEDRSLVSWHQQSRLWGGWRGTLDFANVSDSSYFSDFSSSIASTSQTNLPRSVRFEFFNNPWSVMLRVQDYQTIDEAITDIDKPYKRLPQLAVHGFSPDGPFGLSYRLVADATWFDRNVGVTGLRTHLVPEVSLPLWFRFFNLKPSVALDYTRYELTDTAPGEPNNPDLAEPIYSVDLQQIFERLTKNSRWHQTLEPRILYTNIPFENQDDLPVFDTTEADLNIIQLFRQNRFVGYDRLGDTNQLALGITTRLLDADDGDEFVHATIGNIVYFRDQEVTLPGGMPNDDNSSDYLAEFAARISRDWRMMLGYQWDSDESKTIKAEAGVQFNPEDSRIANLSYRFRRDALEEIDVAVSWPLFEKWNFVGRFDYSLEDNEPLERFAGLEYETCCWGIRAVWRRYLTSPGSAIDAVSESDTSISLQLVLKGFSSVGKSADRLLDRGILEYD